MTETNYKFKTGAKRFLAAIVDAIIFLPLFYLDTYIHANLTDKYLLIFWLIFFSGFSAFYTIFMHFKYGMTFGKMLTKIKVVNIDETKITLKQSFMRESVFLIIESICIIFFIFEIFNSSLEVNKVLDGYQDLIGNISLGWILLELLTMLTNVKRRALHDYIAKTVVIKIE